MSSIYDTGGYLGLEADYNGPGIWNLKANRLFNFAAGSVPTYESSTIDIDTSTVTAPSGIQAGDVIFMAFVVYNTTATITPPPGFTFVGQVSEGVNNFTSAFAWKVAGGSEPSSYTWAPPTGDFPSTFTARYSGVDNTVPVQDANATTSAGGSLTRNFAEVTAAVDNSKFIIITFGGDGVMTGAPAGMTTRVNFSDTSKWFDETIPAGATGTKSISQSITDPYISISLAINPA